MEFPRLTSRQEEFLARVIEEHVRTAIPVGSRFLSRTPGVRLSAASIRAILSDLESAGCLYRPHPSAGRVPTDAGYRYYVDRLMPASPTADSHGQRLRAVFGRGRSLSSHAAEAVVEELSRELHQLALAVGQDLDGPWRVYAGARHMVEQPEFAEAARLAPLLGLLDERQALVAALSALTDSETVRAYIGQENAIEAMRSCTVVGVRVRATPHHAFAVVGPTRLNYPVAMSWLTALRDVTDELRLS